MRFVFHLLLMFAVALATGFGLSYVALTDGRFFGSYQVGPWISWPAVGSPAPDPYTRAFMARNGALQLGLSEGLQFVAASDSEGQPLDATCRYRIEGNTPVATFWTLVPTTPEGVNIARADGPSGFHSARIAREPDGSAQLYVSPTLAPKNWLEIAGQGPFTLVLTLYDTSVLAGIGSEQLALPAIRREACP